MYADDPVLPLSTFLSAPLPPIPWEAGLRVHWLAVNGLQPVIPENTPLLPPHHADAAKQQQQRQQQQQQRAAADAAAKQQVLHVPPPLSQQQEGTTTTAPPVAAATNAAPTDTTTTTTATTPFEEGSLVRAPLKHVVSKELHLYYNKVVDVLKTALPPPAPPSLPLLAVLSSLRLDAGLQPLAPYLSHFISQGVADHITSAPRLHILLNAAVALGANPHLDLGPYLHEIMPAVLTCLLGKCLGEATNATLYDLDAQHWGVRDEAARAVAALCAAYPDAAPRVQRQILSTLCAPGGGSVSLPTLYGGVVGLEAQGPRTVKALLIPNLIPVMGGPLAEDLSGKNGRARMGAALKVRSALLGAVGYCVYMSGVVAVGGGGGRGGKRKRVVEGGEGGGGEGTRRRKKRGPKIAALTADEVAVVAGKGSGGGGRGGRGRAGRGGGSRSGGGGGSRSTVLSLDQVFGEEEDTTTTTTTKTAALDVSGLKMRSMGGSVSGGSKLNTGVGGGIMVSVPSENYLTDAWKDDFPVELIHKAMEQLFDDDLEPYYDRSTNDGAGGL